MSGNFMSDDSVKKHMSYWQLFARMRPYLAKHWVRGLSIVGIILFLAILSRVFPYLIGRAIDEGITHKRIDLVQQITVIYFGLYLVYMLLGFLQTFWFQKLGNRILYYIREDLTLHVQKLPIQYFNRNPIGRIVTRLNNDVAQLGDLFSEGVISVFVQVVRLLAIVVAMALISVKLTFLSLLLTPIFIFWSYKISLKIQATLRESKKAMSTLNAYVSENLNGIKIIQLYNRVPRSRSRFATLAANYRDITLQSIRNYAYMMPATNLLNACVVASALYLSRRLGLEDGIAIGALVAFFFHAQDIIYPIREIIEKYQQFQNSLTSAERVFQLFDEKVEEGFAADDFHAGRMGQIIIRNLCFAYSADGPLVLKNLNLHLPAGKSLAVVGRTGSGKTTLISLLQRFYDAPEQSIFIDDQPIETIPRQYLRRHIGVVQQENFIFKGTVAENIGLGSDHIDLVQISRAADHVGLTQILKRSQRNLQSAIEERGANLSVGERQLIAFARILAFEPDILILDEATSNIDSESESLIQKATDLVRKNRTCIIIAHRLSTIESCDQIVVLQNGELKEQGSHKELLHLDGLYAEMVRHNFHEEGITTIE